MIIADFSRSKQGFKVHIEGHANRATDGGDLVCAAASGMFYALCGYLFNFKRDSLKINRLECGLADLECGPECEDYIQMTCLGFYQLAMSYPENVAIINRAWAWRMVR